MTLLLLKKFPRIMFKWMLQSDCGSWHNARSWTVE